MGVLLGVFWGDALVSPSDSHGIAFLLDWLLFLGGCRLMPASAVQSEYSLDSLKYRTSIGKSRDNVVLNLCHILIYLPTLKPKK